MSQPHPVATALPKLFQLVEAQVKPRPNTQVDFGPAPVSQRAAIGIAVEPDPLVEVAADVTGRIASDQHVIDVPCSSLVWGGGTSSADQLQRMVEAYQGVDLVRDVLAAHPHLGLPHVSSAAIVREQYQPTPDPGALVVFTIRITAHRSRR